MTRHTSESRTVKVGDLALLSGTGDIRKSDLAKWQAAVRESLESSYRLTFGYVLVFAAWRSEHSDKPDSDYGVGSKAQRSFWRGAMALVERGISPVSNSADNRAAWHALAGLGRMPGGLAKAASQRKESGRGYATSIRDVRQRILDAADQKSAQRVAVVPSGKGGKDDGAEVVEIGETRKARESETPESFKSALADVTAAIAALKVAAPPARTADMDAAQRTARSFATWAEKLVVVTTTTATGTDG